MACGGKKPTTFKSLGYTHYSPLNILNMGAYTEYIHLRTDSPKPTVVYKRLAGEMSSEKPVKDLGKQERAAEKKDKVRV